MYLRFFFVLVFLLLNCYSILYAAKVDTLQVYSKKMKRKIGVTVVHPQNVNSEKEYPVLYLLHGYGGNHTTWLRIKPQLLDMSDRDEIIIVCPDGENSWYWDSPINKNSQFETFISKELVEYIDSNYNTIRDRKGRAISGFSMGGHGSLWLAIRHKDIFGAAGSSSGGLDVRTCYRNWKIYEQIGHMDENKERWDNYTCINQFNLLSDGDLSIIIDCGVDDFFFDVNQKSHQVLKMKGISHDYIVRPGIHNNIYWNNSIEYQWLFFKRFFAK